MRDYGEETVTIWDGSEDCEHNFSLSSNIEHDNLRFRGTTSMVGNEKNPEIHKGKENSGGQFCSKCGAFKGQLGLEPSLELYLSHLLQVTAELKRVLKPTGVIFLNLGTSYSNGKAKVIISEWYD